MGTEIEIEIPAGTIPPLVSDIGLLVGLLNQGNPGFLFELSWFQQALTNIEAIPTRRGLLMQVLDDLLGQATSQQNGRNWYSLNLGGSTGCVYVVLTSDDTSNSSTIGLGILEALPTGTAGDQASAYFPLFLLVEGNNPVIITGQQADGQSYPIELAVTISGSLAFTSDVYFTAAPTFSLTLLNAEPQVTVTTLDGLLSANNAVNAVLGLPVVDGVLKTTFGQSTIKVGDLLTQVGILEQPQSDGPYQLGTLDPFQNMTPLQAAEALFADALSLLASDTNPLVTIEGGGIWIFSTTDGASTDYGLRLQVPDVDISPADGPTVSLQFGKFLSVDSTTSTWITRSDPNASYPDPGVLLTLVSQTGGSPPTPSFNPKVALVSLGVDVTGLKGAPLVDVGGIQLGGVEPRIFVALDFANPSNTAWGAAVRFDQFGIPLGSGISSASGNPVASNLLSSGSGSSSGGDTSAVNPTFSASIGWISDPNVAGATLASVLEQADGTPVGDGPVWLPIQRAFGPLQCSQLGIQWGDSPPLLTFLFDGSVTLSILEVDLLGLSLGIPVENPGQLGLYKIDLQGLSVSYASGPLAISGGLYKDTSVTPTEYNGEALIQAATWSIAAMGSYATLNGHPSMFIFAMVDATIGGPPFFFVTGLCAGFGYNRSLRMPTQDEVPQFPLLAGVSDPSAVGGSNPSPATALATLQDWVQPAQGVDWFAAGVQFTSFELVQSNVILVVVIGNEFEIAVLGTSRIKLPQEGPQFAYAELGLEVIFDPSAGTLVASAVLTPNSYVIDPACHLTGGFAFDVWFDPSPHAGDFVVTLGGYHPAFVKPDWYPDEPRLGFSWQINDNLTIQGDAYFALTPSCVMGGGGLSVLFHDGNLNAWFIAQADLLFSWKPYFYSGSIQVSIGASYKIHVLFVNTTVKVELGASLLIYGPPTGGKVHVSWYIISFTVSFGPKPAPVLGYLGWSDFSTLLPQDTPPTTTTPRLASPAGNGSTVPTSNVVKLSIGAGLVKLDSTTGDWLVRGDSVSFAIVTSFPLTEIDLEGPSSPEIMTPPAPAPGESYYVGIRPMGFSSVDSVMKLSLTFVPPESSQAQTADLPSGWSADMTLTGVAAALWGLPLPPSKSSTSPTSPPPSADTLPNRLVGISGLTPNPVTLTGPLPIPMLNLTHDPLDQNQSDFLPLSAAPPVARQPTQFAKSVQQIANTIAAPAVEATRTALFDALAALGYNVGPNGPTDALAANANFSYPDAPLLGSPWTEAS